MRYCKSCLYPETKPDLSFDENGICNACLNYNYRAEVDWDERKEEFLKIVKQYRSTDGSNYDCIVPVSGGKDSHFQVWLLKKKYGMNPLLVAFQQGGQILDQFRLAGATTGDTRLGGMRFAQFGAADLGGVESELVERALAG